MIHIIKIIRRNNMSKIAVVYWSGSGNTEKMAAEVAAGITEAGSTADIILAGDFSASNVSAYDGLAFGCPAMGAEELEESEFAPMFDDCIGSLSNKKVALFGSYGWGDGEWMRIWEQQCADAGITLACGSVICNYEPDSDGINQCRDLGAALC